MTDIGGVVAGCDVFCYIDGEYMRLLRAEKCAGLSVFEFLVLSGPFEGAYATHTVDELGEFEPKTVYRSIRVM